MIFSVIGRIFVMNHEMNIEGILEGTSVLGDPSEFLELSEH